MKTTTISAIPAFVLGLMVCPVELAGAGPVGTAFTYQGRLVDDGNPANGQYDFQFRVFDNHDANVGNQLGSTFYANELGVIDGNFTVELDFGSGVFTGEARWLEIGVRPASSTDSYTLLSPLQEIRPTPYAIHASHALDADEAGTLNGLDSAAFALAAHSHDGVYALISHTHSGSDITTGTVADGLIAASIARDSELTWDNLAGIPAGFSDGIDNNSGGDITAVNAGTGLTGGGTTGDVTLGIGVPLSLGGSTSANVLSVSNSDTGMAIRGSASNGYGGYFLSEGTGGVGVSGRASSATDSANYGGYFSAAGDHGVGAFSLATGVNGTGVVGSASNNGDYTNYGGYFRAGGVTGRGVYGLAANTGQSTNYGGYFEAQGAKGRGVYGAASNTAESTNIGGYFRAEGAMGRGVYGLAASSGASTNYGGYFEAEGQDGRGVYGAAAGGNGAGVQGSGGAYDFLASGPGVDYGTLSSARWKSDVRPIDDPLGKVLRLRGVYFNWDAEHGGQHDVGMIAEEVGEVLPEIVVYEENNVDASGFDYSKVTPLLVEAVKSLKIQADERQRQLVEKDVEIAALKDRLSKLENVVAQLNRMQKGGRQ